MRRAAAAAAVAVAGVLAAGCSSSGGLSSDFGGRGGGLSLHTRHRIVYYLTGTAHGADLTLSLGPAGQSQQSDVAVPLTNKSGSPGLRFTASDGDFLYISAQNKGFGSLTCRITEDGVTVAQNTSSGEFTIVTCDGTA